MIRFIYIALILISSNLVIAQDNCPVYKMKTFDISNVKIDSLWKIYRMSLVRSKSEIDNYLIVTLCNFPEIHDNILTTKTSRGKYLINAKPVFFSGGRGDRNYQLSINADFLDLFNQLSENEKLAYIAHEFSHFSAYDSKTDFGLFIFGIRYKFSNKYRLEIEQKTNELAVHKGFGYQMLEFPYYTKFSKMQELLLNYGY